MICMMRQALLLLSAVFAFVAVIVLATTPDAASAAELYKNMALVVGFLALAVGVPMFLNMHAHHKLPRGKSLAGGVMRLSGIEIALFLMFGSVAMLMVLPLNSTDPAILLAIIALGAVGATAAALEHLWGYFIEPAGRTRPKGKVH